MPVVDAVQAVYRGTPEEIFEEPLLYHGGRRERALDRFGYFTTLSPELLASTIRLNLDTLLVGILHAGGKSEILGKIASMKSEVLREEDPDAPPPLPDQITKFTPEISLLSTQTRRLLRAMDVRLEGVDAMASGFAEMIMNRSGLSLPSVRHDLYRVLSQSLDHDTIRGLSGRLAQSREHQRIKLYEGAISVGVIREQFT